MAKKWLMLKLKNKEKKKNKELLYNKNKELNSRCKKHKIKINKVKFLPAIASNKISIVIIAVILILIAEVTIIIKGQIGTEDFQIIIITIIIQILVNGTLNGIMVIIGKIMITTIKTIIIKVGKLGGKLTLHHNLNNNSKIITTILIVFNSNNKTNNSSSNNNGIVRITFKIIKIIMYNSSLNKICGIL